MSNLWARSCGGRVTLAVGLLAALLLSACSSEADSDISGADLSVPSAGASEASAPPSRGPASFENLCDELDYKDLGMPGPAGRTWKRWSTSVVGEARKELICHDENAEFFVVLVLGEMKAGVSGSEHIKNYFDIVKALDDWEGVTCDLPIPVEAVGCGSVRGSYQVLATESPFHVSINVTPNKNRQVSADKRRATLAIAARVLTLLRESA